MNGAVMTAPRGSEAYDHWVARMERPLIAAALVFVIALCIPVIEPRLDPAASRAVTGVNLAIWLLFAADYFGRLRLAPDRKVFVRKHIIDLVVVVVPFFRPLRLLRLFSVSGILARRASAGLVNSLTLYTCVTAALVAFLGGVATLDVERGANQSVINDFPNALWYAISTMTAVPYGDVYPVTQEGRLVSVFLMIAGLVLVGMITAVLAAWLVQHLGVEQIEEDIEDIEQAVNQGQGDLREILDRLTAIEAHLVSQPNG